MIAMYQEIILIKHYLGLKLVLFLKGARFILVNFECVDQKRSRIKFSVFGHYIALCQNNPDLPRKNWG